MTCDAKLPAFTDAEPRVIRASCLILALEAVSRFNHRFVRSLCRAASYAQMHQNGGLMILYKIFFLLTRAVKAFLRARPAAFLTCKGELSFASSVESMSMYCGCSSAKRLLFQSRATTLGHNDSRSSPWLPAPFSGSHLDAYWHLSGARNGRYEPQGRSKRE